MRDAVGTLRIALPGRPAADTRALAALVAAGAAAAPAATAAGGRVVLVRRARVVLAIAGASAEALAVQAGRALEGALHGALRRPRSADDVLVFASTAEYLAHFVEELAGGRGVDVWYFRPLLACRGRGLGETLASLARAEPDAWPGVLRILRRRGLLGGLLARLGGPDRNVLRGVPAPPPRLLEHAEGWPLFGAAWEAAMAAVAPRPDAPSPAPSSAPSSAPSPAPPPADRRPPALSGTAETAFRRYLATHPAAPESWGDVASLGACVAAMLGWLLAGAAAPLDVPAAEAALAAHPWIDPAPARRVLRARSAVAESAGTRRTPSGRLRPIDAEDDASPDRGAPSRAYGESRPSPRDASAGGPEEAVARGSSSPDAVDEGATPAPRGRATGGSINRTQALRYLHAARLLASPSSPPAILAASADDPLLEYEDEVWTIDGAAAHLASAGAAPGVDRVMALLEGDGQPPGTASTGPRDRALLTVTAAARQLDDAGRRELAAALSRLARARPPLLETDAAGLFFLVRPLVDLGVPGLASRAGMAPPALRALLHAAAVSAAGAPPGDPAAGLFAWGGPRGEWAPEPAPADDGPRRVELAASLCAQARRHGLAPGEPGEGDDLPGLLVRVACLQLVRWVRGFEGSTVEFTLVRFVRRPGAVHVPASGALEVRWPASGYDVVLERAGYLDPLGAVPWWDRRGVRWEQ
ncbi:MAG TPA: hypothetical protein VFE05_08910 [Longimicrobiaceae bacterium]|jgi:hypothetical protein|nr:hypothetical protein [Longimicrobiaceae bacterium]